MKLISLAGNRPKRLWEMDTDERAEHLKEEHAGPITITAQLSHRNYNLVVAGEMAIEVPNGVNMLNRAGSRSLEFVCEDEKTAEELIGGLEASGIPWDEDS